MLTGADGHGVAVIIARHPKRQGPSRNPPIVPQQALDEIFTCCQAYDLGSSRAFWQRCFRLRRHHASIHVNIAQC